ncbi:hypothetical protein Tamer19_17610 [Cupriavidus sp. TA19]|nr:hypothetical protein Tamer19_17610 [Cupriavidus sp. TA19]
MSYPATLILGTLQKSLCSSTENLRFVDQTVPSFQKVINSPGVVLEWLRGAGLHGEARLQFSNKTAEIKRKSRPHVIRFIAFVVAQPRKQIAHCRDIEFEYPVSGPFGSHRKKQENEIVREHIHAVRQDNRCLKLLQMLRLSFKLALPCGNPDGDEDRYYRTDGLEPSGHSIFVRPHGMTRQRQQCERNQRKAQLHPSPQATDHAFIPINFSEGILA